MRETKTSIWGGKSQMEKRVVVTGIGVVSPVGNNVDAMWESIKAGKHGIAEIIQIRSGRAQGDAGCGSQGFRFWR